jgi:hypothetical protein
MQVCISELLKTVKKIEEKVNEKKTLREKCAFKTYIKNEVAIEPEFYVFDLTNDIYLLQEKIRYIRNLIAKLNSTTTVPEFNKTLGECIVWLGQSKDELGRLRAFSNKQTKTRSTSYSGEVEYTEITYDIKEIKNWYSIVDKRISELQMAIDRCNLNPVVEIDEKYLKY